MRAELAIFLLCGGLLFILAGCPGELENPERFTGNPPADMNPQDMNPQDMPDDTPEEMVEDMGPSCDATMVVNDIIVAKCGFAGCHGGDSPSAGLDLSTETAVTAMVDADSACGPKLVVAGDANSSFLYEKVAEDAPACGNRMPLGVPLPDEDITCIEQWINGL